MSDGPHDSPGVFAMTDIKEHAARRRLFSQQFSNSSILSKESIIRAKINMAVQKFARGAHVNGIADIMKWWTLLATDVIAELSFGESFGLLEQEQKTRYIHDLETAMMVTGIRSEFKPLFNILQYLPVRKVQDILQTRSHINSYWAVVIERLKQHIQKSLDASNSLFARFLDPSRHQTELTDFQFAQEAANLIVAGSDTTSISLTYLTYALLRPCNKHVRAKLMDEISSVPIDAPAKDILMLPYLKQVIQESLRIYGGGPSLPREVPPSGATLAGYNIPVGTTVSTQTFTLMRDPQTFQDPLR